MEKSWLWTDILKGFLVLSLMTAVLVDSADAEEYRAWTGDFMRMGAGAKAMGMGNAYTAIEGDIYSSYFNPAGLASVGRKELTFSTRTLEMDRAFRYLAFGGEVGPDAGFALSWLNAGTDDIIGRDLNGNPTGSLEDKRNAFTLSFAKRITDMISVGINTKYAVWKLAGDDATSFGFDLGVMACPINHLTLSATYRDINSRFTWQNDRWKKHISGADGQSMEKEDEFPSYMTLGAAYRMFADRITLAATAEMIEDYPFSLDAGIAYAYNERLTFRTGMYNYNSDDELNYGSFTAGMSLMISSSLGFDYAYMAEDIDDGDVHVLSFVVGYGGYGE